MTIRILTVAAALALPALAQDPRPASAPAGQAVSAETEQLFYKAFFLERGERRGKEAMELYEKFLTAAPNHRYAGRAAQSCISILNSEGKIEEADKLRTKYAAVLQRAPAAAETGAPEAPPPGRAGREGQPGRGQMTPEARAERIAALKKQIEEAKAAGDEEQAARLQRQLEAIESGRGFGGAGGAGGRAGRGGIFGDTKLVDMNDEQLAQFKTGLDRTSRMIDMLRQNGDEERANQLEKSIEQVKKLIDEGKKEEAQKIVDEMRTQMRRRG